ncbi:hypothetical protein [Actinoallomurus sp. NPDC052274]|uniref:hypothetical protein n=1 Tax=Actinoallomurus sp. NPDC052274 TaxID=3155420 RepID=UPI0034340B12
MTKTATDPIAEARQQLDTARQAEADARNHNDELRRRILDGDQAVTAEDLADAGHALDHARLATEAAELAYESARRAARLVRLDALAEDIRANAGDPEAAITAVRQIEEAVAVLLAADTNRYRNIARWTAAMRGEGVPQYEPLAKNRPNAKGRMPYRELSAEHAHLGWQPAAMGHGDQVFVGDRRIGSDGHVGWLIRTAVERACRRTGGRGADWLGLDHKPPEQLVSDPEGWIRGNY